MVQSILNFPPTKVVFNSPGEFLARGGGIFKGGDSLSDEGGYSGNGVSTTLCNIFPIYSRNKIYYYPQS